MPRGETGPPVPPSPINPPGGKGGGEKGTSAPVPPLVHAVCDAPSPLGVTPIDEPPAAAPVYAGVHQGEGGEP